VWYTPVRFSRGWRSFLSCEFFDRAVARRLRASDRHIGFSGMALRTMRASQARFELISPTAHVEHIRERYEEAHRLHPIEPSWLNDATVRKCLAEYERADMITVSSEYARLSFLERGVPEAKLRPVRWRVAERFTPVTRQRDGVFRVVYVGALTVAKGVPVLLDAFARLAGSAELTLLGGWTTRGMRRFIEERIASDPRIRISVGDPLGSLRHADVLVHPSYSDGFAYAPMEALACGLPVIVTEDTGMKDHVEDGENGFVVPTGDAGAIAQRLEEIRAGSVVPQLARPAFASEAAPYTRSRAAT
jgi:glycosyltransferase involved in cell wall biosynthesis